MTKFPVIGLAGLCAGFMALVAINPWMFLPHTGTQLELLPIVLFVGLAGSTFAAASAVVAWAQTPSLKHSMVLFFSAVIAPMATWFAFELGEWSINDLRASASFCAIMFLVTAVAAMRISATAAKPVITSESR